jgi:hypothetical protein
LKEELKMKNSIKVKCIEGGTIFSNDKGKAVIAVIDEGKKYEASLYKPTEEYFSKDSEGREFLVGEVNIDGKLVLEQNFKLAEDKFCNIIKYDLKTK